VDEGLLELQKQHIHNQQEERETLLEQMASIEEERSSLKQVRRFVSVTRRKWMKMFLWYHNSRRSILYLVSV